MHNGLLTSACSVSSHALQKLVIHQVNSNDEKLASQENEVFWEDVDRMKSSTKDLLEVNTRKNQLFMHRRLGALFRMHSIFVSSYIYYVDLMLFRN